MPVIQIATPFNIDIEFEIAEFYRRLLAYVIDFILIVTYMLSMLLLLFGGLRVGAGSYGFVILVVLLPTLFYSFLAELLGGGQTIGKRLLNIRVVSLDGGEPTLGQYLLRWFLRFYEWGFIIFTLFWGNGFVGFAMFLTGGVCAVIVMMISPKGQRLGDIVAGTVVVNTRSSVSVHDTIFQHVSAENYKVRFPEVMRLSDRDINTIKTVLNHARKSNNYDMCNRVALKVQDVLKVSTDMYALDFLETIMRDYNYLATKE